MYLWLRISLKRAWQLTTCQYAAGTKFRPEGAQVFAHGAVVVTRVQVGKVQLAVRQSAGPLHRCRAQHLDAVAERGSSSRTVYRRARTLLMPAKKYTVGKLNYGNGVFRLYAPTTALTKRSVAGRVLFAEGPGPRLGARSFGPQHAGGTGR